MNTLVVDYGVASRGEKRYVLRDRRALGKDRPALFESDSKSEVIAEAQRRKGWEPVDGSEQTYGQQIAEHDGEAS